MKLLQREGAALHYFDPFTPSLMVNGTQYENHHIISTFLRICDGVIILTGHSSFDYEMITQHAPVIFDTGNGTKEIQKNRE